MTMTLSLFLSRAVTRPVAFVGPAIAARAGSSASGFASCRWFSVVESHPSLSRVTMKNAG